MLTIYSGEDLTDAINTNREIVHDVEKEFATIKDLPDTSQIRNILKYVEQAEYNDAKTVIDRFGCKIYKSDISTGCKAAICVAVYPDKIVDTRECGNNAIDAIVAYCKDGNILLYECEDDRELLVDHIDAMINNNYFSDIQELNYYIRELWHG